MKQLLEFPPSLELTTLLINQSKRFLKYGLQSLPHTVPLHNFAQFLFNNLILTDQDLAYKIALKALALPLPDSSPAHTIPHYELCQISLASTLLNQSKSSQHLLAQILDTILVTIKSPSLLYKLSQDAFRTEARPLMEISFKIALQILRLTKSTPHRRRWDVVRWISNCTTELGMESVSGLLQNWKEVFTPTEVGSSDHLVSPDPSPLLQWLSFCFLGGDRCQSIIK